LLFEIAKLPDHLFEGLVHRRGVVELVSWEGPACPAPTIFPDLKVLPEVLHPGMLVLDHHPSLGTKASRTILAEEYTLDRRDVLVISSTFSAACTAVATIPAQAQTSARSVSLI
jgi:hypothetical protein